MVGQQYSPDQRNVLALEYHKVKGTYKCFSKVMDIFATKFPGVRGVLKEMVFKPRPRTMAELKDRIKLEVRNLDPAMIRRACLDVRSRCERVIEADGGFIE